MFLDIVHISGPARVNLPGAVGEDEISDRDSVDVGSLSTPSPPQVFLSLSGSCFLEERRKSFDPNPSKVLPDISLSGRHVIVIVKRSTCY